VGARLYYVIFEWEYYKGDLFRIINLREGGLAIYGGVIAAIITCFTLAKIKKLSFLRMADTGCIGLILGQIIGRWGNFFNREAFGGDSNGLLAMKINIEDPTIGGYVHVPDGVTIHTEGAFDFIQVQPTFFYESFAYLCLLGLIMLFRKKKVFHGEVFLWYMGGYGAIRAVVEGFRTDQLQIGNTGIAVSQVLGAVMAVVCLGACVYMRIKKKGAEPCWSPKETEFVAEFTDETLEAK
jgi:phosphatidylglycerol:prolipoprotein diacylglycerol transferase